MRKLYFFLFFCFYSILQKNDSHKTEGATSLITVFIVAVLFSLYFLSHVWFDIKFYFPKIEIFSVIVICLFIWLLNRRFFIRKGNSEHALKQNSHRNEMTCRIIGALLTIGQIALFISSGVITSKHVWGW